MNDRAAVEHHEAREATERKAAHAAATPEAAHIHVALADRHADLAWSFGEPMDDGRKPGDV